MRPSVGSAAVANVFAMPQSAERRTLELCIARLRHTVTLAELAVTGAEPETAAHYLVDTLDDLSAEVQSLRAALRRLSPPA
jgi:hypothetical protein